MLGCYEGMTSGRPFGGVSDAGTLNPLLRHETSCLHVLLVPSPRRFEGRPMGEAACCLLCLTLAELASFQHASHARSDHDGTRKIDTGTDDFRRGRSRVARRLGPGCATRREARTVAMHSRTRREPFGQGEHPPFATRLPCTSGARHAASGEATILPPRVPRREKNASNGRARPRSSKQADALAAGGGNNNAATRHRTRPRGFGVARNRQPSRVLSDPPILRYHPRCRPKYRGELALRDAPFDGSQVRGHRPHEGETGATHQGWARARMRRARDKRATGRRLAWECSVGKSIRGQSSFRVQVRLQFWAPRERGTYPVALYQAKPSVRRGDASTSQVTPYPELY